MCKLGGVYVGVMPLLCLKCKKLFKSWNAAGELATVFSVNFFFLLVTVVGQMAKWSDGQFG